MIFYQEFLVRLLQHITIFFTLVFVTRFLILDKLKLSPLVEYIVNGVLFAIIAGIGMVTRIKLGEGHYIDGRTIMVGMAAAYVHPIAGIVAGTIVSFFRGMMGGFGTFLGIIGIYGGTIIGSILYFRTKDRVKIYSVITLMLFGFFMTAWGLAWVPVFFPKERAMMVLKKASLVLFISYPIGTLIIGSILNMFNRRKQAEDQILDSENRVREVIDNMEKALAIYEPVKNETDFRFVEVNEFAEKLMHYRKKDVIGKTIKELFPGESSVGLIKKLKETYETGKSTNIPLKQYQDERIAQWVENYIFKLPSGKVVAMFEDTSEQRRMEEALKESDERLRLVIEGSNDAPWDWDLSKNDLYYSPQWWGHIGYEADELPNDSALWQRLMHPDDYDRVNTFFQDKLDKGPDKYEVEFRLKHKKGFYVPVLSRGKITRDLDGKPFRVSGTNMDLTEQKKIEEQIKASLKEKETLLHEIHHRVKNNMQVINSLLKLQINKNEDERVIEILKDSQNRVYAMAAVHETLHGSERLSEIELKSYLEKVTTSIFNTYSINTGKAKLNLNVKKSLISINQAYPLGLVVNELITNSMKYAFPDDRTGEISVKLDKLDNELELIIEDNGIGLPDGFEWTKPNTLGLRLVKDLVEKQLRGSINLEQTNGTKFVIKFGIDKA